MIYHHRPKMEHHECPQHYEENGNLIFLSVAVGFVCFLRDPTSLEHDDSHTNWFDFCAVELVTFS